MSVPQSQLTPAQRPGRGFQPALEGVRAIAAIGVLTTHVAFQTGSVRGPFPGPVWGRFDMAVALFFALSGFLLWRPHAFAAADDRPGPAAGRYLLHRVLRIWPAYVVVVVVVLTLLPSARGASLTVWLANLTLTQVYVPLSLTAGLTQMWSLSVEVTFYLLLPIGGILLCRLRGARRRWRIPVLMAVGVVCLGWGEIADRLPLADGIEPKNWLPGLLPWFVAGMLLAELCAGSGADERIATKAVRRMAESRWLMWSLAAVMFGLSCTHLAGPTGLGAVSPAQFTVKTALGTVLGFAVLSPLVLDGPGSNGFAGQAGGRSSYTGQAGGRSSCAGQAGGRSRYTGQAGGRLRYAGQAGGRLRYTGKAGGRLRYTGKAGGRLRYAGQAGGRSSYTDRFLTSVPLQALGRWSYGIFIWHLVILEAIFPAFSIVPFSGSMLSVWILTVAVTVPVSAVSYSWIETPFRDWLRRRESDRRERERLSSPTAATTATVSAATAAAWIQPSQPE